MRARDSAAADGHDWANRRPVGRIVRTENRYGWRAGQRSEMGDARIVPDEEASPPKNIRKLAQGSIRQNPSLADANERPDGLGHAVIRRTGRQDDGVPGPR